LMVDAKAERDEIRKERKRQKERKYLYNMWKDPSLRCHLK